MGQRQAFFHAILNQIIDEKITLNTTLHSRLLLLASLVFAPAFAAPDPSSLLASVNAKPIYVDDLRDYAKINPAMSGHITHLAGVRRVLNDMINIRLLILEGQKNGIARNPDDSDGYYAMRVRDQLLAKCERLDEAGSKAFYEEHKELFSTPAYARLNKAYLKKSDRVDGQNAVDFMQAQADALRSNDVSFDVVVGKIRGKIPADIVLGDIGFMPLAEKDPIIDQIALASVGDVVGPIERDGNIYIFQVTDRHEPVVQKWEEVLAGAQDAAFAYCTKQNFSALRKEMESHFPVVIEEQNLNALKFY